MILQQSSFKLHIAWLCIVLCSVAGCVSISLDKPKSQRSDRMKFSEPGSNFTKLDSQQVDAAWKNNKTGSIMSVISECSPDRDPRLEVLRNDVIQDLNDEIIVSEKEFEFLGRAALRTSVSGKLDGVETAIELLVVKKDGCNYILTLVAVPAHLAADRPHFEEFLKGFHLK